MMSTVTLGVCAHLGENSFRVFAFGEWVERARQGSVGRGTARTFRDQKIVVFLARHVAAEIGDELVLIGAAVAGAAIEDRERHNTSRPAL
jgi:hypothetical protein